MTVLATRNRRVPAAPRPGEDFDKEWNGLVAAARERLLAMAQARMEIAKLALKACSIIHGGGGHWSGFKGQKTLKSFAEDVGMCYKTLCNWVKIRQRVFDKLPDDVYDERNFGAATRTQDALRGVETKKLNPNKVAKTYQQELARKEDGHHVNAASKYSRTILNALNSRKLDVKKCKKQEVNELINNLIKSLQTIRAQGYESPLYNGVKELL